MESIRHLMVYMELALSYLILIAAIRLRVLIVFSLAGKGLLAD